MASRGTLILGIETSCDETAAAVVARLPDGSAKILSNVIFSQFEEHAEFGGVVPEIAARAHLDRLDGIIEAALQEADTSLADLRAVAVTAGPGLVGGLIVGLMTGKAIAAAAGKPLYCINHLEGHALTARLTHGLEFPYLLLLVSGGHTQILAVEGVGRYRRYATTMDDALGEAFDKTAKLLGLPAPGGPAVERAATAGDPRAVALPRPMKGEHRPDFSFSGLKTALRRAAMQRTPLTEGSIADLCASFQEAVAESLSDRVHLAAERFRREYPQTKQPTLVVAGGVAANQRLRQELHRICAMRDFAFIAPPMALCTDNGAMIAWAAQERHAAGISAGETMGTMPRPRWPLDEASTPVIGSGRKGAKA